MWIYIDDLKLMSSSPKLCDVILDAALAAYRDRKFIVNQSKVHVASSTGSVLGVQVDGSSKRYHVAGDKLCALIHVTRLLVRSPGRVCGSLLRSLVGRWLWACLTRRPCLSILAQTFRFVQMVQNGRCKLWESVRR
jgi:hypothetical protein